MSAPRCGPACPASIPPPPKDAAEKIAQVAQILYPEGPVPGVPKPPARPRSPRPSVRDGEPRRTPCAVGVAQHVVGGAISLNRSSLPGLVSGWNCLANFR